MMKKIAFTKDSKVRVVYFTDEAAMENLLPIVLGNTKTFIDLDDDHIVDDYFFDALKIDGKKLTIDANKAKEIQRNRWRGAREKKFVELDLEFMHALETGDVDKQQEVVLKKQSLRDVTKTKLKSSPDAIKGNWPVILL